MKNTLLFISTLSLGATSLAQNTDTPTQNTPAQLDTVKVSADFRQLDLMQIPSAITVVDENAIKQRNADHLESILSLAPNVNFAAGSSRGRFFQIRGIGERSQFVDPINPSVGLFIDGIDMTGLGSTASTFDIQQVEILRGPQGTAFGANALAGAINIKSNQPTKETKGYIEAKAGNYKTQAIGGAISGSLSEKLTAKISVQSNTSDGYIENDFLNRKDTNNTDEQTVKSSLKWSEDLSSYQLNLLHVKTDNGYDAFTIDNTRNTQSDEPGKDSINMTGISLQTSNSNNPSFTVESNTEFSKSDSIYSYDYDWMNLGYRGNPDTDFEKFDRNSTNGSVDIRLLSSPNSRIFDNSTDWITGAYTKKNKQELTKTRIKNDVLNTNYSNEYNSTSTAIYSELTSFLSSTTHITYGFRVEDWNSNHTDSENFDRKLSEVLYGGKASLNSILNDNLFYINISRGYKAGGFNSDNSLEEELIEFKTEYNLSTELGLKSILLSDRLKTNIAAFYISRKDMQTNNSHTPDNGANYIIAINNAASGVNYGIEAEGSYLFSKNTTFNLALGLLETKISDYIQPYTNIDISGRNQSHSPSYSFSASVDFNITHQINTSIEIEGKDKFFFSDSHDAQSESYELLNASINYLSNKWSISLTGKNLTDEKVETRGFSGWIQDPLETINPGKYTQFGSPRLVALQARYTF